MKAGSIVYDHSYWCNGLLILHVRWGTWGDGSHYLNSKLTGGHWNLRLFSHSISKKKVFLVMKYFKDVNWLINCDRARSVKSFLQERHANWLTRAANSLDLNPIEIDDENRKRSVTRLHPAKLICLIVYERVGTWFMNNIFFNSVLFPQQKYEFNWAVMIHLVGYSEMQS